jgi:hypothetical protein
MPDQTIYHEFDDNAVSDALAVLHSSDDGGTAGLAAGGGAAAAAAAQKMSFADSGEMFIAAQCISATVQNGKVCVKLPFVGKVCLPIPKIVPNGKLVEVCFGLCTKLKIPTGVKVTVSLAGKVILTKTFGKC